MSRIICDTCVYKHESRCEKLLVPALATECRHRTRVFRLLGWTIRITPGLKEVRVCR